MNDLLCTYVHRKEKKKKKKRKEKYKTYTYLQENSVLNMDSTLPFVENKVLCFGSTFSRVAVHDTTNVVHFDPAYNYLSSRSAIGSACSDSSSRRGIRRSESSFPVPAPPFSHGTRFGSDALRSQSRSSSHIFQTFFLKQTILRESIER